MPDEAQPADAGQDPSTDNGLYDLESVDPEIREALQPHLKAIEANATKKFQEAAEYRKGWAPYEELGLKDMDPAAVKQLLDFANIATDESRFDEWLKAAATERGILGKEDDLDLDELDISPEKIQELIDKGVAEKLSPIEQTFTKQQEDQAIEEANKEIAASFEKLKGDHPEVFEGDAERQKAVQDAIVRLGYSYTDEGLSAAEVVQKGFEDYSKLVGDAAKAGETALFADKAQQPSSPEGPGAPNTSPEKITSFDDNRLEAAALAKLKNS